MDFMRLEIGTRRSLATMPSDESVTCMPSDRKPRAFLGQELRLLERGEVSAFGKSVVANQFRIGMFRPTSRGRIQFVGEDAHGSQALKYPLPHHSQERRAPEISVFVSQAIV